MKTVLKESAVEEFWSEILDSVIVQEFWEELEREWERERERVFFNILLESNGARIVWVWKDGRSGPSVFARRDLDRQSAWSYDTLGQFWWDKRHIKIHNLLPQCELWTIDVWCWAMWGYTLLLITRYEVEYSLIFNFCNYLTLVFLYNFCYFRIGWFISLI